MVQGSTEPMGALTFDKKELKRKITARRESEGLESFRPEDLICTKKSRRVEPLSEEDVKLSERRQKNKEAAEKSRRKKREQVEQMQLEIDQHTKDKCKMAAYIQLLEGKNKKQERELFLLKCYIAKNANILGLSKIKAKDAPALQDGKDQAASFPRINIENGRTIVVEDDEEDVRSSSPWSHVSSSHGVLTPRSISPDLGGSRSSSPGSVSGESVGVKPARQALQNPWQVEVSTSIENYTPPPQVPPARSAAGEVQQLQVGADQQVMVLPKDTVIVLSAASATRPSAAGPTLAQASAPQSYSILPAPQAPPPQAAVVPSMKLPVKTPMRSMLTLDAEDESGRDACPSGGAERVAIEALMKLLHGSGNPQRA